MACHTAANLSVSWINSSPTAVTTFYFYHSLNSLKNSLRAPETSAAKVYFLFIYNNFFKGNSIHTISKSARLRTVLKNVSQMGITGIANRFDTRAKRIVLMISDHIFPDRLSEGRPSCSTFELRLRIKKFCTATNTGIPSGLEIRAKLRAKSALSTLKPGNIVLLRGQERLPFFQCFFYSSIRDGIAVFG